MARARADAVDGAIRALYDSGHQGMALLAVGGYGRRQLGPGSDVDLLLLDDADRHDEAEAAFASVLYPLWDAGVRVGHAARTLEESFEESRREVRTLTAMRSLRLLGGSAALAGAAAAAIRPLMGSAFVDDLRESRIEREARAGVVSESQEPDVRDALGGLRDVHVLQWLGKEWPVAAEDLLWRARIALHRATGSTANVLGPEQHPAVAEALGVAEEPDWDAIDVLMRDIHAAGASVASATDRAVSGEAPRTTPLPAGGPFQADAVLAALADMAEHGGPPPPLDGIDRVERWSEAMRGSFLRILASGEGGARAAQALALSRAMEKLLPEWASVRGRPQRDPYHRFPVDVHLVRTAAQAAQLLHRPDEPFAAEAVAQTGDPSALLIGSLLHDIGKVGRGSHVPVGLAVAEGVVRRMDLDPADREDVLFLVGEHLLLSDTATRRDLEDDALIADLARRVATPRRLAMLFLLTVADARATGPAASTPWRMGLIRELVGRLSHAMDAQSFERSFKPDETAATERLATPPPGRTEIRTHVGPGRTPGSYRLSIAAVDRPGLLSLVAGSLTLSGLSVLQAQALTTDTGIALDTFEVGPAFEEDVTEERWRRFRTTARHAMEGRLDLKDRIERLREHYRPARDDIPVTVRIDPEASEAFTVIEVGAADRLGLLFDLARTFADHGLDVHVAKVATYGPRVVDAFYVTDGAGRPLADPSGIVDALRDAARAGT